ncbi:hypothetical protein C5167_018112 [Papaver somniferum]|uniref:Uncharacterized protein n=1 Tax=Papaver somniferum TaxID=3469 RepID=A0A4Y7IPE3_PAPSO|nr:ribonuclease S-7-like [Papaver somniferum]RZC49680.1 hypothetical protein C5167_018112 [Papaver somniferum]
MLRFPATSFLLLLLVLLLAFVSSTTKSQSVVSNSGTSNQSAFWNSSSISSLSPIQEEANNPPSFSNYILAIQFSRSLCNNPPFKTCDPKWNVDLPKKFTIHGLWPTDFASGRKPPFPGNRFSFIELIKPPKGPKLLQNLYQEWIDAYFVFKSKGPTKDVQRKQAAEDFWEYEWKEHGDLSGLSVQDFFSTAFTLCSNLGDVYGNFKAQGLIEVDGNIDVAKASQMLTGVLKVKPFLKCVFDKSNKEHLFEIEIKYDRATLTPVPHPLYSNCSGIKVGLGS